MNLKMTIAVTAVSLVMVAASIFLKSPQRQADRLKAEVAEIHANTVRAMMKHEAKPVKNVDEEALLLEMLKADLQQWKAIEAQWRNISPSEELSESEASTTVILEFITRREQENNVRMELAEKSEEARRIDWDKVPPWEPGAAGPPGSNKSAGRAEPKPEGDRKLEPEIKGLSQ